MKVAIVSCGLLDTLLPLAKHLAEDVELDLYIVTYGSSFKESVGVFDLAQVRDGIVDEDTTRKIFSDKLYQYINPEGKIRLRLFKYPHLKVFNKRNFQLHRKFASIINAENYDVVHFNGYRGSQLFLYLLLNKTGKVWTVHDPILHSGEKKWQTQVGYSLYRFFNAQFILHNSGQRPAFMKRYGVQKDNCHHILFGSLDVFKIFKNGSLVKAAPNTVLFFGRISPYKGVEYLIAAAKKAKSNIPNLKVIIAGKPNYPIDTSSIENDATFEFINGFIPNDQLVKLIQSSAVVICPYIDATQSGVIMTAYAFNKPVIATNTGGLAEMVEDGVSGKLVPPKDVDALSDAMVKLLTDKNEMASMQQNVIELTKTGKFSWNNIAKNTLAVYEKAMKQAS